MKDKLDAEKLIPCIPCEGTGSTLLVGEQLKDGNVIPLYKLIPCENCEGSGWQRFVGDLKASMCSFDEFRQSLRDAGGDAWDELDVDQELAALRGQPQGTEARVCEDITERQALGIAKYGQTVEQNPLVLREWLQHAYEECLDQAVYLKRAIDEMDKELNK